LEWTLKTRHIAKEEVLCQEGVQIVKERRTYIPEFKVRVVLELISGKKSLGEASREYGIKDSLLSR
jgi:transposase-like protein